MNKLSFPEIEARLDELSDWTAVGDTISRTFEFRNFVEAIEFVNRVAEHAEEVQHHPDILVRWNRVTLTLSTHDAGGVTEKDLAFAKAADALHG
ncbi:MAG: 4a-hydroxytetrahydrobiopterin dehydratase [Phycisphaerales bacterium]|nr:4a-hydroxytetrahydrobiopterin dehydratase [Phycisphaerales bacterium]